MPTFQVKTPKGTFEVRAPDQSTALAALGQSKPSELSADDPAPEWQSPAAKEMADFAGEAVKNPAAAQYEMLPAWKKPLVAANDIAAMVANGATFGFGDKAVAGVRSMFTGKSYADELAEARRQTQGSRNRSGWAGTVGEVTGMLSPTSRLADAGVTATRFADAAAPGLSRLLAISGGSAADGAAIGGLTAAGNDTDIASGMATGAVLGGLTPPAFALLKNTFAPLFARLRPDQAANSAIETLVSRTGRSADDIVRELEQAAQDGQGGVFTLADAMGQPAQRMISTLARTPNGARARVVDAMETRQAGQGRRVARFLEEGFGSPRTAAQTEAERTALRRSQGNTDYGAARANARPVDTTAARDMLDNIVRPGISKLIGTGAGENSVYGKLARMRDLLGQGDSRVTDFDRAFMAKIEMDAIIEQGGSAAGLLRPARNALDEALASASDPYAGARSSYRQASRDIEAVDTGRDAARRGRFEDTIPRFQSMTPTEQSGFRAGYVDPLIESAQGAAIGVNKARPLINDATAAEFPVFAQEGNAARLQRQIGREQRMFETRNHATGGSRTADNLADQGEMALFDPTVLGNLITGNWGAAAAALGRQSLANIQGLAPSVRTRIANILLERSPTVAARRLADAIQQGRRLTQREISTLRFLMLTTTAASNAAQLRGQ